MVRTLRTAAILWCIGCDGGAKSDEAGTKPEAPSAPELTPADVCQVYLAMPVPPHVVVIAASATEGAIGPESALSPEADGTGMSAQIVELRAESGAVEDDGMRRIDGIALTRNFTLKHDGTAWTLAGERVASKSEIFFVRKAPEDDPRKLFGAQVIERYGPKGGTPCQRSAAK